MTRAQEVHLRLLRELADRVTTHHAPPFNPGRWYSTRGPRTNPKAPRPVIVHGVTYESVSHAGRALKVGRMTVYKWISRRMYGAMYEADK